MSGLHSENEASVTGFLWLCKLAPTGQEFLHVTPFTMGSNSEPQNWYNDYFQL